ncbi:TPA: glycosyltransferase, partial [Streptococcus suis]
MNKIKICYVINSLRKCGPVEVLLNQIKAIDKSKYHITILTLIDENDNAYISNYFSDYDIINFNYPKAITTLFQFTSIARKINSLDFDILHIHGHVTTFLVHSAKCKKIVTVHNRLYEDFKDVY